MSKRSDFKRRPLDDYPTIDRRAVWRLLPFLAGVRRFAEPCAGDGILVRQLEGFGLICGHASDLRDGADALGLDGFGDIDAIITNPPWTRPLLHAMILHFQRIAPTWLLFDADWAFTKQARPLLPQCSHIVAVGRLIWIPGTTVTGKDNCAWYRFDARHAGGPRFFNQDTEIGAFA
ncbi:hypothetical protein EN809_000735 [Mesorhizobium sp. M2E.F.Ca.ET.166.01.1.1]|nr:hypothetical protein EN809_000735 [Mesorhizobium sp. M2E.F.Ca.ET.166.01.1.1]TGW04078.1 hypothetical protein EN797_000735 [Mesorhizobium sp. M2E.F.Ca.ET.154.01.1.1]